MTNFFHSSHIFRSGIAAVVGAALVGAGLSGCHSNSSQSAGSVDSGDTVAAINDDKITSADLYEAMQHYVPVKSREDFGSPSLEQPIGQTVLWELIQNRVLLQVATQKNVPVTDAEVESRYEYMKSLEENSKTTTPFDQYLGDQGYTKASYEAEQIKPLVARLNLVALGQTVSDADAKLFYDHDVANAAKSGAKYAFPQRVHIKRIIVANKEIADAAAADAKQSGSFQNFLSQNLARPELTGGDASDLPFWISLDGGSRELPANVIAALKKAKTGDVLTVANTSPKYYWVVQVVDMKTPYQMDFNSIKDIVKQDAMAEKGMSSSSVVELQQSMMTALQTASIKIVPKQYQVLETELKATAQGQQVPTRPMPMPGNSPKPLKK